MLLQFMGSCANMESKRLLFLAICAVLFLGGPVHFSLPSCGGKALHGAHRRRTVLNRRQGFLWHRGQGCTSRSATSVCIDSVLRQGSDPVEDLAYPDRLQLVNITENCVLWQRRKGHRTGSDDIFCAWAGLQAVPQPSRILDLGAGQGAVSVLMACNAPTARIRSIEAQEVSYALLNMNVEANQLADQITPVHGDIRDVPFEHQAYDLVTGTPPYMQIGIGTIPRDRQRAACRFELRGGIEAYCDAAAAALLPTGWASFVCGLKDTCQPERYEQAFQQAGLTLRRRILILPFAGAPPTYYIYQGGHGGSFLGEQSILVRNPDGQYTERYLEIVDRMRHVMPA